MAPAPLRSQAASPLPVRPIVRALIALAISLAASLSPAIAQVDYEPLLAPDEPALQLTPLRNWWRTHETRNEDVEGVIETDRPDFTAADTLVPTGWAQLESGYQFTYTKSGESVKNQYSAPQLNLRLGLSEWVELRTLWSGFQTTAERNEITGARLVDSTLFNLQTGFKWKISDEDGLIPQSALITTLFLPTAGHTGEDKVSPMIDYIYGWQIVDKLRLCGSTGMIFADHGDVHKTEFYQSLVCEQTWQESFSTYFEWYATQTDSYYRLASGHNMDGGFTWRPWKNIQFDWRAGFPVGSADDTFFTNVGFSARY